MLEMSLNIIEDSCVSTLGSYSANRACLCYLDMYRVYNLPYVLPNCVKVFVYLKKFFNRNLNVG